MAGPITIYSLHELHGERGKFMLIKTIRPGYANFNENHDVLSLVVEEAKRKLLIESFLRQTGRNPDILPTLLGEFHEQPGGNDENIYKDAMTDIVITYTTTRYGYPWILLGAFESTDEFLRDIDEDEMFEHYKPLGIPVTIKATLITEACFDLSSIKYFSIDDLRFI